MEVMQHPGQQGFDTGRLDRIDDWMKRYVDEGKLAGSSVLVSRNGKIVHAAAMGKRSLDRDLPFEIDTKVRIYSMTKPITSLAVMMLHERGLFDLNAPIDRYLPEFSQCQAMVAGATSVDQIEKCDAPTIHQLLTHTAGFTYSFNPGLLAQEYLRQKLDFFPNCGALQDIVKNLSKMPLAFQPGSKWEYSVSLDVLGLIIEKVSGKSFDQFIKTEITEPLGMNETSFSIGDEDVDRFADCYLRTDDGSLQIYDDGADSVFHESKMTTLSGGGGLVSTLHDYFRFTEMLRLGGTLDGTRLISPRTLNYMRSNHLQGDIASMGPDSFAEMPMEGIGFGLGGSIVLNPARTRFVGSKGDFSWGGLASTYFWLDPVEQLNVIFFTQLIPSSSYTCRAELKALVHGALVA